MNIIGMLAILTEGYVLGFACVWRLVIFSELIALL